MPHHPPNAPPAPASEPGTLRPISPAAFLAWATVRVGVRLLLVGSLGLLCGGLVVFLVVRGRQRGEEAMIVFALIALVSAVLLATGVSLTCAVPREIRLRERAEAVVVGLMLLVGLPVVGAHGAARFLGPEELRHLRNAFAVILVSTELSYLSFLRGVALYFGDRRLARWWLVFMLVVAAAQAFVVWRFWRSEWDLTGEDVLVDGPTGLLGAGVALLALWYLLMVHQAHQGLTRALLRRQAKEGKGSG
jgi:hypothetical protein